MLEESPNDYIRVYRIGHRPCGTCIDNETLEFRLNTKIIIDGLKNSQKFRAVINGVIIGDCQVKDLLANRFQQREQRIAVWDALNEIGKSRRLNLGLTNSFGTNRRGVDVQVDLV